jgi:hypothetical protein
MSNSTAVAATIGVGALGVLAYYGIQNLKGKNVDEKTLYNELDGVDATGEVNFQEEAQTEVAKAVETAKNAWGTFWKGEYASIDTEADLKVSHPTSE